MARVKKQFLELLSSMAPAELAKLQAKLLGPKLKALRSERAKLVKRLKQVETELAGLEKPAPRKRRKKAKPRAVRRVRVVARRRRRKGTMADKIATILGKAGKPLRVRDICAALVKAGVPKKKGLVNYVNRTLSTNPRFRKAGWGLYVLAGGAAAAAAKKASKKKAPKKRRVAKKKAARKKRAVRRKKAAAKKLGA